MSSMMGSQGVVLATAMAVSGTVLLLAFRHQKPPVLRSCISSDARKAERKNKKRVHFAEDVVYPSGDSEIFRRQYGGDTIMGSSSAATTSAGWEKRGRKVRGMPANRLALYNGMLRDRVAHRVA